VNAGIAGIEQKQLPVCPCSYLMDLNGNPSYTLTNKNTAQCQAQRMSKLEGLEVVVGLEVVGRGWRVKQRGSNEIRSSYKIAVKTA
jgi:hypothetical protein